jgi:hypothetical protein
VAVPVIDKRTTAITIKFDILCENVEICMDLNRMKIAACNGNEFMNLFSPVSPAYMRKNLSLYLVLFTVARMTLFSLSPSG